MKNGAGAAPSERDPLVTRKPPRISPIVEPHESALLNVLRQLSADSWLLFASKVARMFSYGFLAVILVIYLTTLHFSEDSIGLLFTLTIAGDALLSVLLTSHADRWGRRFTLIVGAVLAIVTSLVFATQSNFTVLLVAAVFGVISPSGNEIGPFMAIELSALAQVSTSAQRLPLLSWYNLFGSISAACGALTCGMLIDFLSGPQCAFTLRKSCSLVLILYALIQVVQLWCFWRLSDRIEVDSPTTEAARNARAETGFLGLRRPSSQWVVLKLSLLFMLDAFAGALIMQSFVSSWFFERYHTPSVTLGSIVFYCNIAAGVSSLFAARIAEYIGLIMTMVVTHLPSNVLLILVPVMPTELTAIMMLCARYSISQMDIPTRNAYVQEVVEADERSAAAGVTNVARSIGASAGPLLAGFLMSSPQTSSYPFYVAGTLKIIYDLLLLWSFSGSTSTSNAPSTERKESGVV